MTSIVYLNHTLAGIEQNITDDDGISYILYVYYSTDIFFTEIIKMSGKYVARYFYDNKNDAFNLMEKVAFSRAKARLILDLFEKGKEYETFFFDKKENTKSKMSNAVIQKNILKSLHYIRQVETTSYKTFKFEIEGLLDLLNVDHQKFSYNLNLLHEKKFVKESPNSLLDLNDGYFYITIEGIECLDNVDMEKQSKTLHLKNEYVNSERIAELEEIDKTYKEHDLSKTIQLCKELNIAYQNESVYSIIFLVRAIIDHIPPIFEKPNFAQVANNYGSKNKSIKESMITLDSISRKIANLHLHRQIQKKYTLPTVTQVDFSQGLDLLLAEIITKLK